MNNYDNSSTIQLPAGTKEYWTKLMAGSKPIQGNVDLGTPATQAYTAYDDGTQVIIGVTYDYEQLCGSPFGWVFDSKGNSYTGYPIDFSDREDFYINSVAFSVDNKDYLLKVTEDGGGVN